MTPKEKAKKIILKFEQSLFGYDVFDEDWVKCINCALIAVDEILDDDVYSMDEEEFKIRLDFWLNVKEEIEKL